MFKKKSKKDAGIPPPIHEDEIQKEGTDLVIVEDVTKGQQNLEALEKLQSSEVKEPKKKEGVFSKLRQKLFSKKEYISFEDSGEKEDLAKEEQSKQKTANSKPKDIKPSKEKVGKTQEKQEAKIFIDKELTLLEKIVKDTKDSVAAAREDNPLDNLKGLARPSNKNFHSALKRCRISLIAEFKRDSPSSVINENYSIEEAVKIYSKYSDAISVLTNEAYFDGRLDDLRYVSSSSPLPVLRKDFIMYEYQVYESRFYGADAILLIVRLLNLEKINKFIQIANSLNMDCILEVHTKDELETALKADAKIIGINNRDLENLSVDLSVTKKLLDKIPKGITVVSESGIPSKECAKKFRRLDAILVGTALLKSDNLEEKVYALSSAKIKICGITSKEDALETLKYNPDYLGFIFHEKSPRYLRYEDAAFVPELDAKKVGVFVNAHILDVLKHATRLKLDFVQLHGDEDPLYCKKLKAKLKIPIIKAFSAKDSKFLSEIPKYDADYYLFDSGKGGSGKRFDASLIKNLDLKNAFISGGINSGNFKDIALDLPMRPYCYDICSGVEIKPGKKDSDKLKTIFGAYRKIA